MSWSYSKLVYNFQLGVKSTENGVGHITHHYLIIHHCLSLVYNTH